MLDVLFIDDEEDIHFIISTYKIEEKTNFRIKRFVKSAIEALEILEQEKFDIIITDIRMPVMDGLEFLDQLKARNLKQNVIIASTYSEFEYARKALRLGALDYIVKPILKENLIETLENAEKMLVKEQEDKITNEDIEEIYLKLMQENLKVCEIEESAEKIEEKIGSKNKAEYEMIIKEICEKLKENFEWLENIVGLKFEISKEESDKDFEIALMTIAEIISKFELNKQNGIMNNICHAVAENIHNRAVFDIVSEKVELSKDYIGRLFKKNFDMTFNEYASMMKMEYAKHLIRDSSHKIYEISEELGYKTVDYFSKLFKNYTGETPMQYRQKRII